MQTTFAKTFGDELWEGVRCATGYSKHDLETLQHQELGSIKPTIESLDLVDCSWTERATLQKLRDDLDARLQHRKAFLEEKQKRSSRKFATKNYLNDKKYEAALQRDRESAFGTSEVLLRFRRVDLTGREIHETDAETLCGMMHVQEIVLSDNNISVLTALPPMATLAILSSNEIHRVNLVAGPQTALIALSIAGNCLPSLAFVGQLPNLSALDATFNCITSIDDIACNEVLSHRYLAEVNISGNPVTLMPDFRAKVEAALRPSATLKTLDGHPLNLTTAAAAQAIAAATGGATAASLNLNAAVADEQQQSQQSGLAMHFQLLNLKGFPELAARSFDLAGASSKVLSQFYTPAMIDAVAYQATAAQPADAKGKSGKSSSSAAAQAAAAAAQQTKSSWEQSLQQWCSQITTTMKVQTLWMGEERVLSVDEVLQLAASPDDSALMQHIAQQAVTTQPTFQVRNTPASVIAANAAAAAVAAQQAAAQQAAITGSHGKSGAAKHGRGGASTTKSGAIDAAAQKEQAVQAAMSAAASEFVVAAQQEDGKAPPRPTLSREMMIPLRLGLVFNVTGAPGLSEEELPVATVGWASLSPAELIGGACTSATVTAKVAVDRATLLTARERVSKLTLQLAAIRTSLEKEIAENAWRRDTQEASAFGGTGGAGSNPGAAGGRRAGGDRLGGGARGGGRSGAGSSVNPASSPMASMNAADAAALDVFLQSQAQGRKRAEEVYKRLALETAVLSVLEALETSTGSVSAEVRFSLAREMPKQKAVEGGQGEGPDAAMGPAGGPTGGAGDGKKDDPKSGKKQQGKKAQQKTGK